MLTAFLAGLALGAAWLGRWSDRRRDGMRVYAWLEAGVAACGFALPFAADGLDELYTALYGVLEGRPNAFAAARFLLAVALLVPPSFLMGGTLPALVRRLSESGARVGWSAGALYGVNAIGAAAGCALAAFVLIERLGVRGASFAVAGANLALGLIAWWWSRRDPSPGADLPDDAELDGAKLDGVAQEAGPARARVVRVAFWAYALSGFAALGYEIVWSRLLAVILGLTTTQSLSAILVVYLFGLGAGGLVGARRADRWARPATAFGLLELALGLTGVLSIAAFALVPHIDAALGDLAGWSGHLVRLVAAACVVMALPTFLMGLLFPVAGRLAAERRGTLGRRIGGIYAANTAGSILGALAAGFVLVPRLGSQRTLLLFAALNLAAGAAVLLAARPRARAPLRAAVALGAATVLLAALLPGEFVVARFAAVPGSTLAYSHEGVAGTVTVHDRPGGLRVLQVNGAGEVPDDWESLRVFRLLGTLPLAAHPDPDEILVIAFGGGITLSAVEDQDPSVIDVAELVPGVVEASTLLAAHNDRVFERAPGDRIRLIFEDGRNHVMRTRRSYDVILSDSTHPATADSWVLYTAEFYGSARERLESDGIFSQWLPVHGLTVDDFRMILRTFGTVFDHPSLWYTRGYTILLATPRPLRISPAHVRPALGRPDARDPLAEVDLDDPAAFLATLALEEHGFAAFAGAGPINTDDRPYVGFRDRNRAGLGGLQTLAALGPYLVDANGDWLVGASPAFRARLARRFAARNAALAAELAMARGERAASLAALDQGIAICPEDGTLRQLRRRAGLDD